MHLFQGDVVRLLREAAPQATPTAGAGAIARLRAALTGDELERVRLACQIAGRAFASLAGEIRPGQREPLLASRLEAPLRIDGLAHEGVARAGGFAWCMSGPNSALAGAAYARTRNRELREGDLVLVHCNSYLDGYWTDITRTFCLGEPDERTRAMYKAIFAARAAALSAIRPGARAAEVDRAARDILTERGFGKYFTHGLGHNVGFSAISAEFPPRLHPASPDRLGVGMTFNVEPAIYTKGYGGIRHCDVVTVQRDGPEVLTPFQSELEQLIV
jgi:Xaa-Pro aminopeptidase